MTGHPPQPRTGLEEELDPHTGGEDQTSDDRLASDLYKDYSSQNQAVLQIFLALSGAGVGYGVDVRDAYAFFAKEKIDTKKLIEDPNYRAQVKKYAGHVNFWEKGAIEKGTSKLGAVMDGTNKAIKEVDATCEKLINLKEGLIKDYSTELQNLYGLEKSEIDAIMQRAKYAVHADPNISMQDFVQREAQGYARERLKKEVKKEKLTPEQKTEKIEAKLAVADNNYKRATKYYGNLESQQHLDLVSDCKRQLNQVLTTAPPTTIPVQPIVVTPPPPQFVSQPPPTIPISAFPTPSIIPTGLTQSLGNMFGKVGNMFGGLGKGMSTIFGKGETFSKGFDLASKGLSQLAKRGLDAIVPGAGVALDVLGKLSDAFKSLTGFDPKQGLLYLVIGVGAFIIFVPIIIGIGVFSSVTGDKPMVISSTNERNLGWSEFNSQYLTVNSEKLLLDFSPAWRDRNNKKITWNQFEKDYITFQRQYLSSLDANRHDDVQK